MADYPGWKFVRNPGAKTFRKDHVEHQGEVRLKTDFDYWLARNDPSFGGFNNPYPPFGFNSWMWTSPVSRAKCVRLGLVAEGEEVSLSDGQRRQWGLDGKHAVEAVQKMLDRLCKYPQEEPGLDGQEDEEPEPLCKDWGGIPEDMQREIVETVKEMNGKYGTNVHTIEVFTADPVEQGDDLIAISDQGTILFNDGYYETGGIYSLGLKTSRLPDEYGFTRDMVGSTPTGIPIRSVILHEAGHHVCFRAGLELNNPNDSIRKIAKEAYRQAMESGDVKQISKYATNNEMEFFAECFAARELGETLPDYVIDMLEIVTTMPREKGDTP